MSATFPNFLPEQYTDQEEDNFTTDYITPEKAAGIMTFSYIFQAVVFILYNVTFISALIGNTLVIYVVLSTPRMQTVTNFLILNLAVGDLLLALLCVPFSYISVLLQYWPFGEILCYVVSPAQAICVFVSAYTLIVLAIDRYVAILYPLKPRLTRCQARFCIGTVWLIAFITATPIALYTRLKEDENVPLCEESGWSSEPMKLAYSLTLMILQYFLPISVLIFTYTRIALVVWGNQSLGEAATAREHRLAQAKRKTVLMTLIVVCGYTFAWLPLNVFQLYMEMAHPLPPDSVLIPYIEYIFIACHWPAMAHTTFNWFVYGWLNSRFREGFTAVWNKICMRDNTLSKERRVSNNTTQILNNTVESMRRTAV